MLAALRESAPLTSPDGSSVEDLVVRLAKLKHRRFVHVTSRRGYASTRLAYPPLHGLPDVEPEDTRLADAAGDPLHVGTLIRRPAAHNAPPARVAEAGEAYFIRSSAVRTVVRHSCAPNLGQ